MKYLNILWAMMLVMFVGESARASAPQRHGSGSASTMHKASAGSWTIVRVACAAEPLRASRSF